MEVQEKRAEVKRRKVQSSEGELLEKLVYPGGACPTLFPLAISHESPST